MMRLAALALALLLAGCGMLAKREAPAPGPQAGAEPGAPGAPRAGAYYKDDGPGASPPADLAAIPDAAPQAEALHRFANRPYEVFGRQYTPLARVVPFKQSGTASWYGRRYHGGRTSSGEPYDMYAMSAAHPTLPIPSYVRVTNLANGRSVVLRVNDRGPFHADRVIDLSYTAAWKLGVVEAGSAPVEVESIVVDGAPPARAAAPAAAAPEPVADAPQGKGVFLQLGAFSARENAESFRARLARELAWLADTLQVFASEGLFRLHLGPFRNPEEARPVAERIQAEFSFKPLLVLR